MINSLKTHVGMGLAALLIAALSVPLPVSAKQTLKSLKEPLTLQMTMALEGKATVEGDMFQAVLTEDYDYEKWTLPAGTKFSGRITKSKTSHHMARPGYVVMDITEATLPDGTSVALADYQNRNKPVVHKDANTVKRVVYNGLPFFLVNAATTLPLRLVTTVPGMPIGFASKMALGVAKEYHRKDKDKNRPNGHKVGYGVLVGTGLPGIMFTAAKRPEPDLKAGDNIDVYLEPEGLLQVFEASTP